MSIGKTHALIISGLARDFLWESNGVYSQRPGQKNKTDTDQFSKGELEFPDAINGQRDNVQI